MKLGLLTLTALATAAVAPVPGIRDVAEAQPTEVLEQRALFDWLFGGNGGGSSSSASATDNGGGNGGGSSDKPSPTDNGGGGDKSSSSTTGGGFLANLFGGGGGNDKESTSLAPEGEATSAIDPTDSHSITSSAADTKDLSESFSSNVLFTAGEISSGQSKPYQPYYTQCPDHDLVRKADKISDDEKKWVAQRQEKTNPKLVEFLEGAGIENAKDLVETKDHNLSVGLAFSGGGYRAMLAGAGELLALDGSFKDSKDKGLGGILQGSTYLVGLSGGNWLVGTMALNDGLSVGDIWSGHSDVWNLEETIFNQGGFNVVEIAKTYTQMGLALDAKNEAGFDTSITDLWGRALSYQFFPQDTRGGENVTWSDIRDMKSFSNHDVPFPIVVANGRTPGSLIINENSTVFEFNPYEMGTWDPSLSHMVDIKYLGTQMSEGKPIDPKKCVVKFDNGGFIMGTSSSLFNQALVKALQSNLPSVLKTVVTKILDKLNLKEVDVANYRPNPFYNVKDVNATRIANNETLYLVDGGEDDQNVPFYPLIQPDRKVDVIIAYDNSADTHEWPNGTSIASTYQKQFSPQGKGAPFPYAPPVKVFLDEELGTKPVFFGCNASSLDTLIAYHNVSDLKETDIPLVVHIPNSHYSYEANTSTYKMYYSPKEKYGMIQNGFEVSSRGNFTDDEDWKKCVACAIVRRSEERQKKDQSDDCRKCFERYCWTGTAADAVYDANFAQFLKDRGEKTPPVSDVAGANVTSSKNGTNSSSSSSSSESTSIDSSSQSDSSGDDSSTSASGSEANNDATTSSSGNGGILGGLFGGNNAATTTSEATGKGTGTATATPPTTTKTIKTQGQLSGGSMFTYNWLLLLVSMLV